MLLFVHVFRRCQLVLPWLSASTCMARLGSKQTTWSVFQPLKRKRQVLGWTMPSEFCVRFQTADSRQSCCVWPRQSGIFSILFIRGSVFCASAGLRTLTLIQQPHASGQIFVAFKKMFNTHLLTMLCGACFLQAARAWPEEILCKASALSSFDLCTTQHVAWHVISAVINEIP